MYRCVHCGIIYEFEYNFLHKCIICEEGTLNKLIRDIVYSEDEGEEISAPVLYLTHKDVWKYIQTHGREKPTLKLKWTNKEEYRKIWNETINENRLKPKNESVSEISKRIAQKKCEEIQASKRRPVSKQIKEPEKGGINYLNLVLIGMGILFFVNMEALGIILSVIGFAIIGVMLFAQLWIAYVLADAYAKEISKGTKYIYWIALVILVVIIFIGISPR
ncbi:MAG: hypothetical protein RIG77_10045 [Cyclobacteriaceae bacterium]